MKILNTTALSYEIENIITSADDFLIIISPYLKIHDRLRSKLDECIERCNYIYFIFREDKLHKEEKVWLNNSKVTLVPIKNLHAKCYLN
jgi:hypothetical protein